MMREIDPYCTFTKEKPIDGIQTHGDGTYSVFKNKKLLGVVSYANYRTTDKNGARWRGVSTKGELRMFNTMYDAADWLFEVV